MAGVVCHSVRFKRNAIVLSMSSYSYWGVSVACMLKNTRLWQFKATILNRCVHVMVWNEYFRRVIDQVFGVKLCIGRQEYVGQARRPVLCV